MNKKVAILTVLLFGIFLVAGNTATAAVTFGDDGASLQGVLDDITIGGNSSVDVNADQLGFDTTWAIAGADGSVSTVVIELAGWANSNTFGVYDAANSANMVQIFDGAATTGSQAVLSIGADGSVYIGGTDSTIDFAGNAFGYYLDATHAGDAGGLWYSDTNHNTDGQDHMAAYQGTGVDTIKIGSLAAGLWGVGEYALAFEDLNHSQWSGSEPDFNDLVVMVASVNPVPIPGSLLLLGSGIVGLIGFGKRMRKKVF